MLTSDARIILPSSDTWLDRTVLPFASLGASTAIFRSSKSCTCVHHLSVFAPSLYRYTKSSFCVLSSWRFSSRTPNALFSFDLPALLLILCADMSSHAPPPRVNPKDLYAWASRELLDECSSLLSTRAVREHMGDPCSYDHRAFAKRHDDDITVLPCTLGEPVCGDERANDRVPFFYFYQVVFKSIGVRLPFSRFERELLTEINAAPAQLYPNS